MISTNDLKTGLTIEIDGQPCQVLDFQHVKPGKGAAFVRSKLKNLQTGAVIEKTFNSAEKIPKAHIEKKEVQYLYSDGQNYNFMDMETYDQFDMDTGQLGNAVNFLKENMNISILLYKEITIGIDLPNFVELAVNETSPGVKGDTVSGGTKPATTETGYVVQVPFFVEEGDILQIDTRTGHYIKRV
ncbi:MAG: elongation factor P [Clostridiales bacterium]|nr:elongation factor P [Clostridiales bacterium]MCF8021165.1 elongation factor P [Clostridiales bacterium]